MSRPRPAYSVQAFAAVAEAPPEWAPVFANGPDVQSGPGWFEASAAGALPGGARACFVAVAGETPALLLPLREGPGRQWASLTTPYSCLYQPLTAPGLAGEALTAAAAAFGRRARGRALILFEAMDPAWSGFASFRAGLRQAGLVTREFAHFGNWHEPQVASWPAYLDSRPGPLRETIRRRMRAAHRDSALRLEVVTGPGELGRALAAYETVYARSWKPPEPYPAFNQALIEALGPAGVLRFGLMWSGSQPIAAQYWTVSRGVGTVLKLAHDGGFKAVSPGTVLTAHTIRHLIEVDGVTSLDFGRGDDPYKAGWASERRQRVGLAVFDPLTPGGAAALLRHEAGSIARFARKTLRRAGGTAL